MSEAATKPDIVVGVDGSDESFAALKWALEEASLTGQSVNAVFGWTHSWDMGSEPDSDEAWAKVRHDIANELRVWVDKAAEMCIRDRHGDGVIVGWEEHQGDSGGEVRIGGVVEPLDEVAEEGGYRDFPDHGLFFSLRGGIHQSYRCSNRCGTHDVTVLSRMCCSCD